MRLIALFLLSTSAVIGEESKIVIRLIEQLGSAKFVEREAAMQSLQSMHQSVLPALRKAATHPDLEIRSRVARLIQTIESEAASELRERSILKLRDSVNRLRGLLTIERDIYGDVLVSVDFAGKAVTDADLANIEGLDVVCKLNLYHTKITDRAFGALERAPNLRELYVSGDRVTDRGIATLERFHQLEVITFANTRVTAIGLDRLYLTLPNALIIALEPPTVGHR